MLTQHIALVPEEDGLNPSELARVSAALQKQVTRDLLPLWSLAATVDAFPALEDVPVGYWPIILTRCELGNHGRVHIDRSGQPYAQVQLRPLWSLAASRACLEMLVNPYETRSVSAPSLRSDQGPVDFLVEVCAPCEDPRNAYVIDGILVSDFCTPAFFGARSGQAERYTARGMLIPALRPQPGGHMTWYDAISDSFWLRNHWADNPIDTKLGAVDRKIVSVRELVHACTPLRPMPDLHVRGELEGGANRARASQRRAQQLRALLGKRLDQEFDAAFDAVRMDLPPVTPPAAEARAKPAAEVRPHAIEIEPGEFEDIDTFVQLLDELPEQMELLEEIAVPPRSRSRSGPGPGPGPGCGAGSGAAGCPSASWIEARRRGQAAVVDCARDPGDPRREVRVRGPRRRWSELWPLRPWWHSCGPAPRLRPARAPPRAARRLRAVQRARRSRPSQPPHHRRPFRCRQRRSPPRLQRPRHRRRSQRRSSRRCQRSRDRSWRRCGPRSRRLPR